MKLFLPQKTLEEWALADKADLADGKLVVKEGNSAHPVSSAVHFQKLVSGEDTHGLVGRVKTSEQLTGLLGKEGRPIVDYGERLFHSQGFERSLTEDEKNMRLETVR